MESTRFTTEEIEGYNQNHRLPRVPRRHRRRKPSSCCWNCNSQIVCSYLIALISSVLVVAGVYLSLIHWNRIWLIISVSGIVLTLFGSCLYYCGTQALVNSAYNSDEDDDSYDYEEEENDGDNDEEHFPRSRNQRRRNAGRNKKRKRGARNNRASAPEFVTRSLSQLSLNMIPQYFSPADTSFIRVHTGTGGTPNVSSQFGLSTSDSGVSSIAHANASGVLQQSGGTAVPVSQIFSVNGQSYVILPLNTNGDSSSLPPTGGTIGSGNNGTNNSLERRREGGIPLDVLSQIPSPDQIISEKGNISEYLKQNQQQLDPSRYYKLISQGSNSNKNSPNINCNQHPQQLPVITTITDGSISHGPFGTKINRKSLNRGRIAPGHGHGSANIQDVPLPPTPGCSSSSSAHSSSSFPQQQSVVPISILDHNPLARINSVNTTSGHHQMNADSASPGLIPKRSSSLKSRPSMEERKQATGIINSFTDGGQNGDPGIASTSNYFISFIPSSSNDGKVQSSSSSFSSAPSPLASASTFSFNSHPKKTKKIMTGNTQTRNDVTANSAPSSSSFHESAVSSASSFSTPVTTTTTNTNSSSSASIQRGDTFSKRKKPPSVQLLRSVSDTASTLPQCSSSSYNSSPASSVSSHGQQQQPTTSGNGNNGYLPLNDDESGDEENSQTSGMITSSNQRKQKEEKGKGGISATSVALIDLSNVSGNFVPSTSSSSVPLRASSSFSSGSGRCDEKRKVDDRSHLRNYSGVRDSADTFDSMDGDSCHERMNGAYAAGASCHQYYAEEELINNIYEESEDFIPDEDIEDQFSPPPSYAEVIQDSHCINYTPINYDARIPSFINPVTSSSKVPQLANSKNQSIVIVMDSKVSSESTSVNPATNSGSAIHSTGTL